LVIVAELLDRGRALAGLGFCLRGRRGVSR
jgi:hypothetical protein